MRQSGRWKLGSAALALFVTVFPACGGNQISPAVDNAIDQYSFKSLDEMVATSDAVVEGTVVKVETGRTVGPTEAPLTFSQVTLQVDAVLYGNLKTDPVLLEEDGTGYSYSETGSHSVYFITYKGAPEEPFYRLVSSAGRFIVSPSGTLEASNDEPPWVVEIETLDLAALKERVAEATLAIERGEVKPAPPVL